jgi:hypothetical protein
MDYKHAVITLTENREILSRLRGMGILKKDAERGGKEYYTTQFDGNVIRFYAGEPRTFPEDVGKALESSNHTYLDEKCIHCNGQGRTVAGVCINCKGRKTLKSDQMYRTLKVIRTYDAMLVDPAAFVPVAQAAPVETAENHDA